MIRSYFMWLIPLVVCIGSEDCFRNNFTSCVEEKGSCKTELDSVSKRVIYTTGENEPANEGGTIALIHQYRKLHIDSLSLDSDTRFVVAFIVEEDGKITAGRVIRDHVGGVGQQILNLVKSLNWEPGTCNGKKVAMIRKIELQLCLQEE